MNEIDILLVDAQERQRAKLSFYLRAAGYGVESANTFQEARAKISAGRVKCIVAGVKLGPYNGLQLVSELNRSEPSVASVITHDAADCVLEREARNLGAAFVILPCAAPELVELVRHSIAQKSGSALP